MGKLSEHEKVTVIKFNEGSREASIYTFNADLKRRLEEFAGQYPPSCEEHRAAARAYAEEYGLQAVQSGREPA